MRSLIVDDDATTQVLLRELLAAVGACDVASDGLEALEAIQRTLEHGQPYDLICLDISMPNLDGHETLRRIRTLEAARGVEPAARMKVIMTTSRCGTEDIFQALEERCEAYLLKPISHEKLWSELKRLGLA